ncbi:hypothetical protein K435DRAFT_974435 [Dendrothele bispora CBS 962.96]|uniref:Cytosolic endo-beta-N-acetylglucosaminidase TIM barrel domain-containing protein n=1 Tax=Dendrothele bispora (strain CBS 962.96) TaxID=1314807 RepID=A0A4S8KLS1_DENBC|nr:hypothetical protein K435DRAFT_974435 [Dendrothele bispora CBS 962.96]
MTTRFFQFYDIFCWKANSETSISANRVDTPKVLSSLRTCSTIGTAVMFSSTSTSSSNGTTAEMENSCAQTGVKMLGTLIFEHDEAKPDCLRLLVGQLPKSSASTTQSFPTSSLSLPLSPHYARLLAQLAVQRGFDGYLLNFECPLLQGGVEQTRVGMHAEVVWYDSVIFTGHLAWQDRLNSLNLPFFLSSDSIFTNYTWRPTYPNLTAQYFLSLSSALTQTKLRDIYMGIGTLSPLAIFKTSSTSSNHSLSQTYGAAAHMAQAPSGPTVPSNTSRLPL